MPVDVINGKRYYFLVIKSFNCKETERLFKGMFSAKLPQDIQRVAARKLKMLNDASGLEFLRVPPANRLEVLVGDRSGQHSIRVNGQWRICFTWVENHAFDVEIVDYH